MNTENLTLWALDRGLSSQTASLLAVAIGLLSIGLLAVITYYLIRLIVRVIVYPIIRHSKTNWDDMLIKYKVLYRCCHLSPAITIHLLASLVFSGDPKFTAFLGIVVHVYFIVIVLLVIDGVLNFMRWAWESAPIGKRYPAKSFIQATKLATNLIGLIFILAALLEKSPLVLFSGLGAITAILLLIFKDAILGLVAGFQLSINNMVMVDDWIEMPGRDANGSVIDVSLTTVKVQNWDKTITAIPSYVLISESFKNWRGMSETGARRIKRSILIDLGSIRFLDTELLERLRKVHLIKDYLDHKTAEIKSQNASNKIDPSDLVNGRCLTNIGTFRAYCLAYISQHPKIHKEMTLMVRQLPPTETGLPLEIYAFTNDTEWLTYEGIQSDFFDHLISALPDFELQAYQHPTGKDFAKIGKADL
ncbi:MAG: Miniconductance mechanosensitive channel YbdG [Opitutia bacterium UBA7350]|nr:MAG: Miniconductance mechanosensitive channel YbdG [Opitutae bacterium UBA7350]